MLVVWSMGMGFLEKWLIQVNAKVEGQISFFWMSNP